MDDGNLTAKVLSTGLGRNPPKTEEKAVHDCQIKNRKKKKKADISVSQ
jgi:hypothetical protein